MHNENDLNPAERELESALRQIRPNQDVLEHELFLFQAGRASAGRPWQLLSGALMIGLLCSVLLRPDIDTPQREAAPGHLMALQGTESLDQARPDASPEASAYLALRQRVVQRGLKALPSQSATPGVHATRPQSQTLWLERML